MNFKDNPKKFYAYINGLRTVRIGVGRIRGQDGAMIESDAGVAEELCRSFHDVFVKEEDVRCGEEVVTGEEGFVVFEIDLIVRELKRVKPDKSPGPDGIHPMVLNKCAESLGVPLSIIFTRSYEEGVVPSDWREANVSPIHKKGDRNDPGNYRPVSLTSVVCKVMESIVKDRLLTELESRKVLTQCQHGFRAGKSCLTNTLEALEAWTRLLDEGFGIDVVFLDYRKAFDTVSHTKLLQKLKRMGICGRDVVWIREFLTGRRMRVMVNGCASTWREVGSGVPQGSVLGPLLFLLFVNDLPDWIKTNIRLFADDAKVWRKISSLEDREELQEDLNSLGRWSRECLLQLNPEKCKVMHIGHEFNTEYTIEQEGKVSVLEEVSEIKDLGIVVSRDLKVARQCAGAAKKAMSVLGLIKRHFGQLDRSSFRILYNSYVRTHLEFCIQSWSPYLRKDIDCLERVQHRATKLVEGMRGLPYEERLRRLNMTTLERRRLRGDMIETYKILTGRERIDVDCFFKLSSGGYSLRGHCFKLYKDRSRLAVRRNFFSQRVVGVWNGLSAHVVEAPSVNSFKNRIDKEWGNTGSACP